MEHREGQGPRGITRGERLQAGNWSVASKEVWSSQLSLGAKVVYAALDGFLQDRSATSCSPTEKALASSCNLSVRSIRNYVHELQEAGHIKIEKRGTRNLYVFLSTNSNRQEAAAIEHENRQEAADSNRQDSAASVEPDLILPNPSKRGYPQDRETKRQQQATAEEVRNREPDTELDVAAAAVLSSFPSIPAEKTLRKFGAELVLHAARRLRSKQKKPKNPAGLFQYILRHPDRSMTRTDAMEMLQEHRRERAVRERKPKRSRSARSRSEIFAWLNDQEDRVELRAAADKYVRSVAGGKADENTITNLVVGFYWRERKKRERALAGR